MPTRLSQALALGPKSECLFNQTSDNYLLSQEYVSVDLKHGKPGISKSEFKFLTLIISTFGYFSHSKCISIFLTYRHNGD